MKRRKKVETMEMVAIFKPVGSSGTQLHLILDILRRFNMECHITVQLGSTGNMLIFSSMPGHFLESEVFVSADILVKMMEFEWIDDLTSEVFVASFIYFPNADAISLCLNSHMLRSISW